MQCQNPILDLGAGLFNAVDLQLSSRLIGTRIFLDSRSADSIQGGGVLIFRVEGGGG